MWNLKKRTYILRTPIYVLSFSPYSLSLILPLCSSVSYSVTSFSSFISFYYLHLISLFILSIPFHFQPFTPSLILFFPPHTLTFFLSSIILLPTTSKTHTHTEKQTLSYILHSTSCFIFNHTNGSSESFTLYVTYTYLTLTSCSNHVFCLFCGGCKYNRNITLRGTMCQHLEAGIGMIIFHSHSALKQQDKVVFFTIVTTLKLKIKISMLLVICMIIMLLLLLWLLFLVEGYVT